MWEGIDTSSSSQLKKRSYPMSEPNYHKIKWFSENLLATEINKKSNNEQGGVCRSFTSWHMQYIDVWVLVWLCKTKNGDSAKLCCTDTESIIVHVKS